MSFSVTPQPDNVPPRVRIDVNTDDAGASFTALSVMRDGKRLREQPFPGSSVAVLYDYEAPFGTPVTYSSSGSLLPAATPDWTESWASLSNWAGSGFTVSGGLARSTVPGAQIVRGASGTIQRLMVLSPSFVRVELLDAAGVVVASVQVGTNIVVTGTGTTATAGSGSFSATLTSGTMTVTALDGAWSVSRAYVGSPTQVRVVSLGVSYPPSSSFAALGQPVALAIDSSGAAFVADFANSLVRKFNASGTQTLSFSTTGRPRGVAVDSTGNIYVADVTNSLVRKFNASGTQTLSFSTTGRPLSVAVDASGNIFVGEYTNKVVRKFNPAGTQTLSFSTIGEPAGVAVDASGNIFVADDENEVIRKFNSAGGPVLSFSVAGDPRAVMLDSSGNIFVADGDMSNNTVRRFDATGVQTGSFPTVGQPVALAFDASGNIFVADYTNNLIRKLASTTPSVGAITETPATSAQPFAATASTTLNVTETWLIHPSKPSLSIPIYSHGGQAGVRWIEASSGESKASAAVSTVHRPIGRRRPVVITSGPRQADEWTLVVESTTIAAKNALRAIVDDQTPLLLRSPASVVMDLPDDWYSVGDVTTTRLEVPAITQITTMTLPLVPVDEPVVRVGALWTWGDVLTTYSTWQQVLDANATWLDVLAGPQS